MLVASKSPKRSLEAGATRMDARRGRILQGRSLAPDPVAARDKLREPRSGDFVRQGVGVPGGGAFGRPRRAPCGIDFIWHSTLKERNRSHIPNSFAHMLSNQP